MNYKKLLTGLFITGTVSLFLSSCGGGSSDSGSNGSSNESVNQASADDMVSTTSIGENLYRNLQNSTSNISNVGTSPIYFPPLPTGTSSLSISKQQTTSYCTGSPSGNLTDIDDDGIPVDGTYDFTCNYPNGITMQGKISAKDDNDNDALSGFDVCTGSFSSNCTRNPITTTSNLGTLKQTLDFNLDGNATAGYTFTTFYYKWEFTSNGTITAQLDANNLTYNPDTDGNNDPWDKGIWNGDINFTATDDQGNSGNFTISLTNLHIGICSDGSATGSITFSGNCPSGSSASNFNLTVNLTSCGHGTANWTDCDGNTGSYNW